MLRQGALLLLWASAAPVGGVPLGPEDAVAMVQQQQQLGNVPRPLMSMEEAYELFNAPTTLPPLPMISEYDIGMKMWLKNYFSMLRERGDLELIQCCAMVQRHNIFPGVDWGTAPEEDQQWWKDRECDSVVGNDNPEEPVGAPYCPQRDDKLGKMLPPEEDPDPFANVVLAEEGDENTEDGEGLGCDEEDRLELNNSYIDRSKSNAMSDQCRDFYLIDNHTKWTKMVPCISQMYGVRYSCSRCYVNFLRAVGGDNTEEERGCFHHCMVLGACPDVSECYIAVDQCSACTQPALKEYWRCVGGPIYHPLSMRSVFEGMYLPHAE